ncbi:hypothetical protein [Lactiplantibacillus plantarum]|uniref:hypothetical protein n=1 Tax=Lactiplantibacillus plantarum TaxID=1590 RepID=UPI003F53E4DD
MPDNSSKKMPRGDKLEKRGLYNDGANIPAPSTDKASNPFVKPAQNANSKSNKK